MRSCSSLNGQLTSWQWTPDPSASSWHGICSKLLYWRENNNGWICVQWFCLSSTFTRLGSARWTIMTLVSTGKGVNNKCGKWFFVLTEWLLPAAQQREICIVFSSKCSENHLCSLVLNSGYDLRKRKKMKLLDITFCKIYNTLRLSLFKCTTKMQR